MLTWWLPGCILFCWTHLKTSHFTAYYFIILYSNFERNYFVCKLRIFEVMLHVPYSYNK